MPEKQRPKISKYNLVTGADTYSTQTSQNPDTARFLKGWIPSDDGGLYREWNDPQIGTGLPANKEVRKLFQFDFVNASGVLTRFFFAVVATSPGATTYNLWQYSVGGNTWTQVNAVGTLANVPSTAKVQSTSLLHLSDGVTNWLFDGTTWLMDGFKIPLIQPAIDVNGIWRALTVFAANAMISDSNGNIQLVSGGGGGSSGTSAPHWATASGSTTTDGALTWTCYGPPLTWTPSTVFAAHVVIYNSQGDFLTTVAGGTSAATEPTWDGRSGQNTVDNTVTWVNRGKFVPFVSLLGYVNREWKAAFTYAKTTVVIDVNGNVQVQTANGAVSGNTMPVWSQTVGGVTLDNTASWTNFGQLTALASWQPNSTYQLFQPIVDLNGNFQVVQTAGTSGANLPNFSAVPSVTTTDNTVTWQCETAIGFKPTTVNVSKYYWTTELDRTAGRVHESSSSPISLPTGILNHQAVTVNPMPGLFNTTAGSPNVTINSSSDVPGPALPTLVSGIIGKTLFIDSSPIGVIAAIGGDGHSLVLAANAGSTNVNRRAIIADARATHMNVYQSESDGSKIGQQSSVPVVIITTPFFATFPFVTDTSDFTGGSNGTSLISIFRPVRNDPPVGSLIAEVHKYRIFKRRETKPNFFNYTANEEVSAGLNGDPTECTPGTDINTLSDIINEQVYPDSSNFIRAICSHGDALYIATEKQCVPLYGQSIDDFGLSQVTAFSLGAFGQFSMISTAHGLALVSYDGKIFIYPTSNYYWAYVPNDVNVTDNLIEIGKPLRKRLETVNQAFPEQLQLTFYFWGRRNWLVLTFRNGQTAQYESWVYDFTNKGWFQLANGYSSTAVWEISTGDKILVGGSPNGGVFALDDLTGTFVSSGNQPNSVWRPALIDFGDPDMKHIPLYVEFEVSNSLMANDIQINYYLDPVDADNPGTARNVIFKNVPGSNLYRGFFQGGNLCQRLLIEFNALPSPVSTNSGHIRGVKLVANPASGLM